MPLLLVPDTNVFVHFNSFLGLPWKEIAGQDDVVVIVLADVVRELDKLKLEPRLRDRMRDVLPRLEALFAEGDAAVLQDGTPARFEYDFGIQKIMEEHDLESRLGDDRILAAVLKLQKGGDDVVIVSDDVAMRLRARGLGIPVLVVADKYRLKSADPLQAENAKLRRELDDLRTAAPRLDVQFTEGGAYLTLTRAITPLRADNRLRDALQLRPLSLGALPIIYKMERMTPTQAEVDAYNQKLEDFRPTWDKYVAERDAFERFPHQSIALELTIRNTGGRPADEVKLSLQLPEGVTVVDEDSVPEVPVVPVTPRLPGRRRGISAVSEQIDSLKRMSAPALDAEAFYKVPQIRIPGFPPNVTGPASSPGELRFGVHLLSNFDEVMLPHCFLRFPTPAAMRSFKLKYTLRSHSLSKIVEGELHVVISAGVVPHAGEA